MKTFTSSKAMCRRFASAIFCVAALLGTFSFVSDATASPSPASATLSTSQRTVIYKEAYETGPPVQNGTGTPPPCPSSSPTPAPTPPDCTVSNLCSTFDLTIDPSVGTAASGYDPTQYQIYMKWQWKNGSGPIPGQPVPTTNYDVFVEDDAQPVHNVIAFDTSTAQPATIVLPADPAKTLPGLYHIVVILANGSPIDSTGAGVTGTIDLDLIGLTLVSGNGADLLCYLTCDARAQETTAENWESEPSIAVNPTDPNNLVAAWIQGNGDGIAVGYSVDGGSTWKQVVPPETFCTGGGTDYAGAGDPWVSFGPPSSPDVPGIVYLSSLVGGIPLDPTGLTGPAGSAEIVIRSTDGGKTWPRPPAVLASAGPGPCDADGSCVLQVDGSFVVADPFRPGFAYASWTLDKVLSNGEFSADPYVSHTTDGGLTWSAPSKGLGPRLILPDGSFVTFSIEFPPFVPDPTKPTDIGSGARGPTKVLAARSTDGGTTWSDPITVADPADPNILVLPSVALAPDGKTIYVAWQRTGGTTTIPCPNASPSPAPTRWSFSSLMYSKSTDGGRSWKVPAPIEGPPIKGPIANGIRTTAAAAPSLAVAPDGTVGVAFYDHRNDTDNCNDVPYTTDLWFRHSQDEGQTWEEEHLTGPFNNGAPDTRDLGSHFIGDYQGIAPVPGGFATAFVLGNKIANSSGQHLSHPPTDVFYLKVSLDVPLTGVVSRKVHGDAGAFDIDLPRTGTPGIECRSGGSSGDYTLVFTFANTLTSVGGASVTSGTGSVSSSAIGSDAHQDIVNLTGVTNAQVITVSLTGVTDSAGDFSSAVPTSMGVLLGDTTGNGSVNSSDISQTKAQSGTVANSSNFRTDVTVNGLINSSDISTVKSKSGTALP